MATTVFEVLVDEHRGFKAMLTVMEAVAGRLHEHAQVPRAMLADLLDFFEMFTNGHHEREENVLFPMLERHGMTGEATVITALLTQHDTGRMYCRKMRADLARLDAGDASAAEDLSAHAAGYCELIREHIRIEDDYFYRLASELLTDTERQAIVAEFSGLGQSGPHPQKARFLRMMDEFPQVVAGWK
jgi:hemerythrin-like domain-containing protein